VSIRYPHDGARFAVDPDRPRSAQSIPLKVDAPSSSTVSVFVDGRLSQSGVAGEPIYFLLEHGSHLIVAEADGRRSEPVTIRVE
jgi:hypothetical protein